MAAKQNFGKRNMRELLLYVEMAIAEQNNVSLRPKKKLLLVGTKEFAHVERKINMSEELTLTVPFIAYIPKGTIALKLEATIYDKGEMHKAVFEYDSAKDIQDGMIHGYEWEGENVHYRLTDGYKKELGIE